MQNASHAECVTHCTLPQTLKACLGSDMKLLTVQVYTIWQDVTVNNVKIRKPGCKGVLLMAVVPTHLYMFVLEVASIYS
jgi:hypothetical protein